MAIKVIHLKPEFEDERGYITRLIDNQNFKLKSVLYIKTKAGSVRANHYHKKDSHYSFCVSGRFKYSEKDNNDPDSKLESVILESGGMVFSAPLRSHVMEFLEDTVFLAFTSEGRDQEVYEEDTIRVKMV